MEIISHGLKDTDHVDQQKTKEKPAADGDSFVVIRKLLGSSPKVLSLHGGNLEKNVQIVPAH